MAVKGRRRIRAWRHGPIKISEDERPLPVALAEGVDPIDESGILRVDTGSFELLNGLSDVEADSAWWRPGRVMLLVVGLAIVFIAFIAWEVASDSEFVPDSGWRVREVVSPPGR